ncbi:protein argonaute 2-like isoform X2 [Cornus florida]|uniref:protein argonaute 2-like isoform X2 n=1 Tax=Cornus florida TaxID=4283 RepID=UPI0028A1FB21|nr:protein argonaute 2-like isoform X2 [Cornus florida]
MERSNNYSRGGGGGRGRGRGGGGGGRGGNNQHQGGGRGRGTGMGMGMGRGATYSATNQQPANYRQGGAYGPAPGQSVGPTRRPELGEGSTARVGGVWGVNARTALFPQHSDRTTPDPKPHPDSVIRDIQSLKISEQLPPSSLPENTNGKLVPIKRPDRGGSNAISTASLAVNHFRIECDPNSTIMHYDVDIRPEVSPRGRPGRIPKSDLRMIINKLFSDDPTRFPMLKIAYDGEKNIFSAVLLPIGTFKVELSDGEGTRTRSYIICIKLVNELEFSKLEDYISGNLQINPRDVLQGVDVVMKEDPSKHMICIGRSFYTKEFNHEDNLRYGITAAKGFQQSVKPTYQGPALCLDYSVLPFHKPLPVIDFLKEHFEVHDVRMLSREVITALKGLKVTITHRVTNHKYTIAGLSDQNTQDLSFDIEDPEGNVPPRKVGLVDYYREKYDKEIMYNDIPCLDLGKNNWKNYVPMEFCVLVEGQKYPQEHLDGNTAKLLKKMSLVPPEDRKKVIYDMVQVVDRGDITQNFGIQLDTKMTTVTGRVIEPPKLKVGAPNGNVDVIRVDKYKCEWRLVGKCLVDAIPVVRWALIDFSSSDGRFKLISDQFIRNIKNQCRKLGLRMEDPLVCRFTQMRALSNVNMVRKIFAGVIKEASGKCRDRLQIVVCVTTKKEKGLGHNYIKWISDIEMGIVSQCCLATPVNKGNDAYLANLALKINAKLGGSNIELERLPHFEGGGHVMFVGADVNHPTGSWNSARPSPSIAAVVATVNWPALNRYAARIWPQDPRIEKILKFGSMCLDLIDSYAQFNKVKPQKIVVFRDGVSEGQFDMVLNEELLDLKKAIETKYGEMYRPTITLVVAQKRHQTRLFPKTHRDGGSKGNVNPGTVVDTVVVHPFEFDFYLCSHYGSIGTSKCTHYYVLYDQHNFTSDQVQELIYHLCFTCARCTKPVSLVTPVYYADLVAFRGRLYQEVVEELFPAEASFDEKKYKVHGDLEDTMFFI